MPKLKMPKSAPSLDMTPMVDLAFLLVTFFMLTAQFRPEEVVAVDTPSSMSEQPIPTDNLMTIIVDTAGHVLWDMTDRKVRIAVLEELGKQINHTFSDQEKARFAGIGPIGVPIQKLPAFLSLEKPSERKEYLKANLGIPMEESNNQLRNWIIQTRQIFYNSTGENVLVALKADGEVKYSVVAEVVRTFQSPGIEVNKFKMITDLETSRL